MLDVAAGSNSDASVMVFNASTTTRTTLPYLELLSVGNAAKAITTLQGAADRITAECGVVGGSMARMEIALSIARSTSDNLSVAAAKILDVNIAEEVAKLIRNQVFQKATNALLAQANQSAALVLKLLG